MKRGREDEKILEPMFPRLHVNDADKGGPRAPPRNKMALYEQLSIPSQRFNPSKTSHLVPPASSSQGSAYDRNFSPIYPPPMSAHLSEKFTFQSSDGGFQRKKVRDEDDYTVPVFFQSKAGQGRSQHGREKYSSFSPSSSHHSMKVQSNLSKDSWQSQAAVHNLRRNSRSQSQEDFSQKVFSGNPSVKSAKNSLAKDRAKCTVNDASGNQESQDQLVGLDDTGAGSLQDYGADNHLEIEGRSQHCDGNEPLATSKKGIDSRPANNSPAGEVPCCATEYGENYKYAQEKSSNPLLTANPEDINNVPVASLKNIIAGFNISPDDILGVIGEKRFWKARSAIVKQQRVFAVQVFELHRLIKVQRLIAASPHLLLEDPSMENPILKGSHVNTLTVDMVKRPSHISKHKEGFEKPNQKINLAVEDAEKKTSVSSARNDNHASNYRLRTGEMHAPVSFWGFQQPSEHQWLIPVMSPSEGLVYKAYPEPGFMGAVCGGCGPYRPTPMMGNFMNPAYGLPPNHQGMGFLPGISPINDGYFPAYGLADMVPTVSGSAVEQMRIPRPSSNGQVNALNGEVTSLQHQGSCNVDTKKSRAIPWDKAEAFRDSGIQGSVASSLSERPQGFREDDIAEARDALPLFPMAPSANESSSELQPNGNEQTTRVIRVIPHNPMSATESAARIFRCIQEERKLYDST